MDMNLILASIGVFLGIILLLVVILLVAKQYLTPSGFYFSYDPGFHHKNHYKTTERKFITMNRNRKLRKQMMSGLAVGMAAVMGAAPV